MRDLSALEPFCSIRILLPSHFCRSSKMAFQGTSMARNAMGLLLLMHFAAVMRHLRLHVPANLHKELF